MAGRPKAEIVPAIEGSEVGRRYPSIQSRVEKHVIAKTTVVKINGLVFHMSFRGPTAL